MSQIPQGAIQISFAADRTAVDKFLAELRQGYTVPIRPTFTGGQASAGAGPMGGAGSPGGGPVSLAGGGSSEVDREARRAATEQARRIRRVDAAWDRAALAEQKAAERAEAAAQEEASRGRRRFTGMIDTRIRRVVAGFATYEGLRLGEAAVQRSSDLQTAEHPLDRAAAEMRFANAVAGVPILGQLADLYASPERTQAELAMRNAREGMTEEQEMYRRQAAIRQANREATMFRTLSGPGRQEQAIRGAQDDREKKAEQEGRQRLYDISASLDEDGNPTPEYERRLGEYNRWVRGTRRELDADAARDQAQIEAVHRNYRLTLNAERRRTVELTAGAEGRFGEAAEDVFHRELQDRVAAAPSVSGEYAQTVGQNNLLAIRARAAEQALALRGIQDQANAIGFEVFRDPLNAQLTRIAAERRNALARATPGQEGAIGALYDNEATLSRQQYNDTNERRRFQIGARNEQLGILADRTTDPATRSLRAQVDEIRRRTELQSFSIFQQDANEGRKEAPAIFRGGQLELQALQQRYLGSFRAEEVNPNRTALTGSGTENPTQVLKDISDAIKELKKVPQTLQDILTALGNLVAQ